MEPKSWDSVVVNGRHFSGDMPEVRGKTMKEIFPESDDDFKFWGVDGTRVCLDPKQGWSDALERAWESPWSDMSRHV